MCSVASLLCFMLQYFLLPVFSFFVSLCFILYFLNVLIMCTHNNFWNFFVTNLHLKRNVLYVCWNIFSFLDIFALLCFLWSCFKFVFKVMLFIISFAVFCMLYFTMHFEFILHFCIFMFCFMLLFEWFFFLHFLHYSAFLLQYFLNCFSLCIMLHFRTF